MVYVVGVLLKYNGSLIRRIPPSYEALREHALDVANTILHFQNRTTLPVAQVLHYCNEPKLMPLLMLMANMHGRLMKMGGTFGDLEKLQLVKDTWVENLCNAMYKEKTEKLILQTLGVIQVPKVASRHGRLMPTRGCRNLEGLKVANENLELQHAIRSGKVKDGVTMEQRYDIIPNDFGPYVRDKYTVPEKIKKKSTRPEPTTKATDRIKRVRRRNETTGKGLKTAAPPKKRKKRKPASKRQISAKKKPMSKEKATNTKPPYLGPWMRVNQQGVELKSELGKKAPKTTEKITILSRRKKGGASHPEIKVTGGNSEIEKEDNPQVREPPTEAERSEEANVELQTTEVIDLTDGLPQANEVASLNEDALPGEGNSVDGTTKKEDDEVVWNEEWRQMLIERLRNPCPPLLFLLFLNL